MQAMYTIKLEQNREDRPRYVTLVKYEPKWVLVTHDEEILTLVPTRRTWAWVMDPDGKMEAFVCVRVTELPWRAIKPQQAHRDIIAQWKQHLATLVKGCRPVQVEVVP